MEKRLRLDWNERSLAIETDELHPEDVFIQQAVRQMLSGAQAPRELRVVARALAAEVLELALDPSSPRRLVPGDWLAAPTKIALRRGFRRGDVHQLADRMLRWPGLRQSVSRRVERALREQLARAISHAWVHSHAA